MHDHKQIEVKFRGKRIDNGDWVYGYYVFNPFFRRAEIHSFDRDRSYVSEVIPETVGRYTGLKVNTKWDDLTPEEQRKWLSSGKTEDEWNGKEIYEGDILEHKYEDKLEEAGFGIDRTCVEFQNFSFGWIGSITGEHHAFESSDEKYWELIGNIHDNSTPQSHNYRYKPGKGIELIAQERQRQIEVEGWTPSHDAKHTEGELANAAAYYAMTDDLISFIDDKWGNDMHLYIWPFDLKWLKRTPKNRIKELQKSGALIAAEIERLQSIANGS